MAVIFRRLADGNEPSPAVLRIALESSRKGLVVRILKSRGGQAATVQLGWLDPTAQAAAH
jgi:hypothetical protein